MDGDGPFPHPVVLFRSGGQQTGRGQSLGVQEEQGVKPSRVMADRRFDAATFAVLGALCSALVLSGWAFDLPGFRGFGIPDFPMWPLTAIAFLALALGHLAAIFDRRTVAAALWVVPLAMALMSAAQTATASDFGIDRALFGELVSQSPAVHPGRPGLNPSTILVLLSVAGYLAIWSRPGHGETEGLAVALAVGVTAVAVFLALCAIPAIALLSAARGDPISAARSISIPSAMSAICVASAIIVHYGSFEWIRLFAARKGPWRVIRLLLPAALVLPLLPPIIDLLFLRGERLTALPRELLLLLCNLLMVAIIGYWTAARIARDQVALRRREVHLQSLLDTVPDAILVLDDEGFILRYSAAAEALWGYREDEVAGHHFTMLASSEAREGLTTVLRRFLDSNRSGDRVITAIAQAKDGRIFPVEARTGVAQSDQDLLLTVFVRDLSAQVASEARLRELNSEIAHVSRQSAMSELAADLAHELNQPLSATSNFLAAARMLIERGEDPERISDLLRMGIEQTQRAGEIIRRLRTFMARGEVEMRAERVDSTVRDAVDLVLVGAGPSNIRVDYRLDPNVRFVFADRIQVQQVIVNLLRNAIDALRQSNQKEKIITIISRPADDDMVEIAVNDNGPGIPPHVLDNIFSRFITTKGVGGGMGIGLSISKRIIEAHGGTLRAENRQEGGACFRFTLPEVEKGEEE